MIIDAHTHIFPPWLETQRKQYAEQDTTFGTLYGNSATKLATVESLIASKENRDLKFRVYIHGGGCSGFQYGFQFEEEAAADDLEFKRNDVQVVVDPMSLQYLNGAEIDFIDDLQGSRFVVNNPNAATTCGCGASFGI